MLHQNAVCSTQYIQWNVSFLALELICLYY